MIEKLTPPLPWDSDPFRQLFKILYLAYDTSGKVRDFVVTHAPQPELITPRINWDSSGGVETIWRDVLDVAARAGQADRLIMCILDDHSVMGWHQQFREVWGELPEPDAPTVDRLSRLPQPAGTLDDLHEVKSKLSGMYPKPSADQLVRLLWAAACDVGPLRMTDILDIESVLELLDNRMRPGVDALPPILAFLEYFSAQFAPAGELEPLLDRLATQQGVGLEARERVRNRARKADLEIDHVSIYINVLGDGRVLRPEIFVYRSDTVASFKHEFQGTCSPAGLRGAIEDLIEEIEPVLGALDLAILRFEFVLPWNLLNEAVDDWQFGDGRRLGRHSQVVVRSLERERHAFCHRDWHRRSAYLRNEGNPDLHQVIRPAPSDPVLGAGLAADDPVICLTFAGPYVAPVSWRDDHPLLDAIKSGLPTALWFREPGGDPRELKDFVLDQARGPGLEQLPSALLRRRQKAILDHSITLLWDYFDSRPVRPGGLRAPGIRRRSL